MSTPAGAFIPEQEKRSPRHLRCRGLLINRNEEAIVCNGIGTVDLSVYPQSGGKLNNSTADLPLVVPANRAVRFRAIDGAGNCMAFF